MRTDVHPGFVTGRLLVVFGALAADHRKNVQRALEI